MRRGIFFFIAVSAFLVSAFCSCSKTGGNGNRNDGLNRPDSLSLETVEDSATYHLFGNPSLPAIKAYISLTAPSVSDTSEVASKARNDFMINIMGGKYSNLSLEKAAGSFIDACIEEYKEHVESEAKNRKSTANEAWMNYETYISTSSVYNNNGLWCYLCNSYIYTGGAHGLSTSIGFVYDVYDSMPVTLNDIFDEESLPAVLEMIKGYIDGLDDANAYWKELVTVSENFTVNEEGITWYYNPYEIAPYYIGITAVPVSFDKLKPYIIKDSPINSIIR